MVDSDNKSIRERIALAHQPDLVNHVYGDHLESLLKFSACQWNILVNIKLALCDLYDKDCIGIYLLRNLAQIKAKLYPAEYRIEQTSPNAPVEWFCYNNARCKDWAVLAERFCRSRAVQAVFGTHKVCAPCLFARVS